ncbi:MAG: winged helix-turn-helix transcriptional regulator [Methylococcus sp.]
MNENDDLPIFERSPCPVTNVLDLFGDKWTLLVVRDLLMGKTRYGEFAQGGLERNGGLGAVGELGEA